MSKGRIRLSCLACGLEGYDDVVAMTLVEIPKDEQRVVSVGLVSAETNRGPTGFEYSDVRERYVSEPRCRDKRACAERVRELAPTAAERDENHGPQPSAIPGSRISQPAPPAPDPGGSVQRRPVFR